MKSAGCYHIKYGIESGSKRVLKSINKEINLKQAERAIQLTKKVGIESKSMFMIGLPKETMEDMQKSLDFAKKICSDITTFLIFTPFPGCELYARLKSGNAIRDVSWGDYSVHSDYIISNQLVNAKDLKDFFNKAYKEIYLNPKYLKQRLYRFLKDPIRESKFIFQGLRILKPALKNIGFGDNCQEPSG